MHNRDLLFQGDMVCMPNSINLYFSVRIFDSFDDFFSKQMFNLILEHKNSKSTHEIALMKRVEFNGRKFIREYDFESNANPSTISIYSFVSTLRLLNTGRYILIYRFKDSRANQDNKYTSHCSVIIKTRNNELIVLDRDRPNNHTLPLINVNINQNHPNIEERYKIYYYGIFRYFLNTNNE
jgi:hypothetical protein